MRPRAALLPLVVALLLPLGVAQAAAGIGAFDGKYACTETVTVLVPGVKTPRTTGPCNFTVSGGRIDGGANGVIVDSSGDANLHLSPGGLVITGRIRFTPSGDTIVARGTISGHLSRSGVTVAFVATISAHRVSAANESSNGWSVPQKLEDAHYGQTYDTSFCTPEVPLGHICGFPADTHYFDLGPGSDLVPRGLHLDFRSGRLYGTPLPGSSKHDYTLVICAKKLLQSSEGPQNCRTTTIHVGP